MDIPPILLGFSILLTTISYFLAANGKINAFPTYLGGLAFLAMLLRPGAWHVFREPAVWLSLAFLGYLSLSVSWSSRHPPEPVLLYIGYAILLAAFLYGIPLVQHRFSGFVHWLINLTLYSALVSCCYSIYLYYALPDYQPLVEDRLYAMGRLDTPTIGALSYGMAAVLGMHRAFERKSMVALPWIGVAVVLLSGIFLTGTRSVWIGLFAALVVGLTLTPHLTRQAKMAAGLVIVVVLLVVLLLFWATGYYDELAHRAMSFRPEIWSTFLQMTLDSYPLFGAGANAYSEIQPGPYVFEHAHSIYLATFYYGGIVGLGLLLSLLGVTLYRLILAEDGPLRRLTLTMFTFSLIALAFDGDRLLVKVDYSWLLFWLPLSLAFCVLARKPRASGD